MTNSDQLRTFVTIAELENLTAAASRLNKTQSAISVQIRKLEEQLGVVLFDRNSRGMTLTRNGARLLPRARTATQELDSIGSLFRDPLQGSLRVGVPDDYEDGRLERVLASFSTDHPGVDVHVTSGCSAGFAKAIERGDLDIAVQSGLTYGDGFPLNEEDLVWASGREYNLSASDQIPLAVLEHECWYGRLPREVLDRECKSYRVAFSSQSFASLCSAIRAGLAISVVARRVLTTEMRVLGSKDGLPKLPKIRQTILTAKKAPRALAAAMSDALMTVTDPALAQERKLADPSE